MYDAVVIGSGPNGLAAAITLAEAGQSVLVLEAAPEPGGGTRSGELIEPGVVHDVCSAVHVLGVAARFFREQDLESLGLRWVHPEVAVAHPLDGGSAAYAVRDLDETAASLGAGGTAYRRLVGPLARRYHNLLDETLAPVLHVPRHPVTLTRFGIAGLLPADVLAKALRSDEARALFAGSAAHALLPLSRPLTSAFGLLLLAGAHADGWPFAAGGSGAIAAALVARLTQLGGELRCDAPVSALAGLPPARRYLFDLAPRQIAQICGDQLPPRFRARLMKYRHGPGAFKLDYVLSDPVPWTNQACRRAGTVHVGGRYAEIAAAEAAVGKRQLPEDPFVLVTQPTVADPTRAPAGRHVLWAYTHVPNGSTVDMTERIERQIERFAPGFRDTIVARRAMAPADLEAYNPSYLGGDIANGAHSLRQIVLRPTRHTYRTPNERIFLCSAATPPGAGVHGMCGYGAARAVLNGRA